MRVDTEVLVVGAGPTGLMLANWLAKLGIDAVLVDGKRGPTRESRALGIQARSMEIYDQLGVADEVLALCRPAAALRPGYEKRMFSPIPLGILGEGLTPFPRVYLLEQSINERILAGNLRALGRDVLWEHEVRAIGTDATTGFVSVTLDAGDRGGVRSRTITARFCVGTDGSSSTVRKLLGIPFDGLTNPHTFYVCDATAVAGVDDGKINIRLGGTDALLSFPMTGERHARLIGVVPAESAGADADVDVDAESFPVVEAVVRDRVEGIFGVSWGESAWFATYRVHHRVAARFRQGAFFLAGDAAHVHSPVGAQGMNTGLQDAHNLAFKLADVVRGRSDAASLDRYEAERRPVALRLVGTTDRLFGFVTSRRLGFRIARRLLFPAIAPVVARVVPAMGGAPRLFGYVSQIRIHYWMSDAVRRAAGGRRGVVVGRRLPWTGGNFDVLRELTWQVHVYGSVNPDVVERISSELGVRVHVFPASARTPLVAGAFYLVRPDGFVAAEARADAAVKVFRELIPVP